MFKFSDEIKDTLAATKFVWMATATKDGSPNVVIVAAFKLLDDETLLISDQYFLKTLANLKDNPKVAISWWGEKGGFQIKGNATIHTSGPIFKSNVEWMKVKWSRFGPKGAVVVKIIDAYVLRAGPDSGKRCYDSGLV